MIEVVGTLDRESNCYLAGEVINVKIVLTNLDKQKDDNLAWILVQLHCDRTFPKNNRPVEHSNATGATSVKASKEAIYSTKPDIILCNWNVAKGGSELRERNIPVPLGFPPSFKGQFVRYSWYIQIAVQRIDSPIQTLYLPLRILNSTVNNKLERPIVSDPFLRNEVDEPLPVDLAMAKVEEKTAADRKTAIFDVNSGGDHFATINMAAGSFKLGDVVQGFLEFPDVQEQHPQCVQVLVCLETVEENLNSDTIKPHIVRHNHTHITTVFMKQCHFRVPIPITALPTFTEQAVRVTWRVHFEFTVTRDEILNTHEFGESLATDLSVQALTMDQPIFVHSTNPINVGMALHHTTTPATIIV